VFVAVVARRCPFRVADLLVLAEILGRLRRWEGPGSGGQRMSRGISSSLSERWGILDPLG
jgi:hypothetical protein